MVGEKEGGVGGGGGGEGVEILNLVQKYLLLPLALYVMALSLTLSSAE